MMSQLLLGIVLLFLDAPEWLPNAHCTVFPSCDMKVENHHYAWPWWYAGIGGEIGLKCMKPEASLWKTFPDLTAHIRKR